MFEGEKTWVFWLGLIILGFMVARAFFFLWTAVVTLHTDIEFIKAGVPSIVGGVVFIVIGLYMMKSGVKKKSEG